MRNEPLVELKSYSTCIQASGGKSPQGCGALVEIGEGFLSSSDVVIPEESTGPTIFSAALLVITDTVFLEAAVSLET